MKHVESKLFNQNGHFYFSFQIIYIYIYIYIYTPGYRAPRFLVPVQFLVLGSGTVLGSSTILIPICTDLTYLILNPPRNKSTIHHNLQYGTNIPIKVHK